MKNSTELIVEEAKGEEEKSLTKTLQFTSYSELEMQTRPEFYSKTLENIGNQCIRGRKRTNVVSKAPTLQKLIQDIVIPEWEAYLTEK